MRSVVKKAVWMILGVAALVLAGVSAAKADETINVKVPFAFVVNGTELPAGEYVITRDTGSPELIQIATADGRRLLLVLTQRSGADGTREQPQVEFERVGKDVVLTQVTLGPGNVRDMILTPGEEAPRK